jgi:hypothetical protein
MADTKISALSSGAPAQSGDEYVIARSGANYKLTLSNIASAMPSTTINGSLVVNEAGGNNDTRIEGDSDANLFFASASTDRIGIGTNTPSAKFDVSGDSSLNGAVVINEAGADKDTRIEGDTDANLLFVDASTDRIGVSTNTPSEKIDLASGNLTFSSTSQKITGKFNGLWSGRTVFQSYTTNADTRVSVIPNGTSTTTSWSLSNSSSDPNNAGSASIRLTNVAASLNSNSEGTGTPLPMQFNLYDVAESSGGVSVTRMVILNNGNVGIGAGYLTPGSELDVKGTLRLSGSSSGYVGIAPAAAAGSTTYTLPSADGSNGNVLSTNGSGTLSWIAAGGTGTVTSVGGTGTVNGITLTGTVTSSGNLTLGGTLSGVDLTSQITGTLPVANGGTGQTSYTNGQLLIGNSTGNTLTKATLTAGSGISITNGSGAITIAATGGTGTVTSVSGTGTVNGLTLTGTVTSSGNLTLGGTLSVNLASDVTGTLPVANGGTGLTSGTSGGVLAFTAAGTIASSTALAANALVVGGGAGAAPSSITTGTGVVTALGVNTGSAGAFVVNGGALGTPSSGTLTSCTGLPVSTGISGLGSNVATWLATPSSANLAAAVTDETGTGALVFANTPTLVTPVLGTPTSGNLSNCTADGTNAVGYRNIPRSGSAKTTSYTLATGDVGEFIEVGSGGSITIPDATFATGDVVSVFNNTSGNITITCTITTAYIAGTDSDKATVTLATRGVATILFISGTVCVINGNVS